MTASRAARPLLLALGGAAIAAAVVWWGLAFFLPVANAYLSPGEAGRCLVADSSLCRLALSLCSTRHVQLVTSYSPLVLWLGAAVAFAGLAIDGLPRERRRALAGHKDAKDARPR